METRTAIESHNLSFSYGTLPVLENVSFSVPEGSYTALIGANGAGKSTLLKLLLGELTPTSGSLSLLGQPIRSFRDWPRIGYVPQGTQAGYADFPASVSEVVSAGLYKKIGLFRFANASHRKEIARALSLVGMDGFEKRPIGDLSGGQRQRVLLARAICQQPRVLILDEPTSFLDIRYKLELLTILKDLVRERSVAVVLSLHELDLAQKISDRVICVANGEIARVGTPEEVFTDGSVQRLYGLTAGSYDERFGSLELEPVRGAPQALVIGGGGSGIALYRALQRHGIPFAAGVLHENDMDFPVARALACEIVSEQPYQPIGNAARSRARALMHACRCVYAPLRTFGPMNEGNRLLIAEAAENGWLVSAISPKKPDAT